jgi:hypothetical protein
MEVLSRIYHSIRLRLKAKSSYKPVFVFQMGKVGSTAVVDSIRLSTPLPVYHIHYLTDIGLIDAEDRLRRQRRPSNRNVNRWCIYESHFVRARWSTFLEKFGTPRIISLVRDPVARNLSSFFYSIDDFLPNAVRRFSTREITIEDIADAYLHRFREHDFPMNWLVTELQGFTALDLLSSEFDQQKGYGIYKTDRCELLLIKLESLSHALAPALHKFLGVDNIVIAESNSASELSYFETYAKFKDNLPLPVDYINQYYDNPIFRHFYSDDEIRQFRDTWLTRIHRGTQRSRIPKGMDATR